MQVENAFFARHAEPHPDGSWSVLGGGVDTIPAGPEFPSVYPNLAIVFQLSWGPEEHPDNPVEFQFAILMPNGQPASLAIPSIPAVAVRRSPFPGDRAKLAAVIHIGSIPVTMEGVHYFVITVNQVEAARLPLRVARTAGGGP